MSDATSARELVLFLPAVFKLCHSLISSSDSEFELGRFGHTPLRPLKSSDHYTLTTP